MAEILILANETIVRPEAPRRDPRPREARATRASTSSCRSRARATATWSTTTSVRDSAQVRVDLARGVHARRGHRRLGRGRGPRSAERGQGRRGRARDRRDHRQHAAGDPVRLAEARPDRRPETQTGLPVNHIVVDLAKEGLPFEVTLVVANQTVASPELVSCLKQRAEDGPRRFVIVVPQDHGEGTAVSEARAAAAARCCARCARRSSSRAG